MFDVLKVFIKRTARVATQVFGLVIISLPVLFHLEENYDQCFELSFNPNLCCTCSVQIHNLENLIKIAICNLFEELQNCILD